MPPKLNQIHVSNIQSLAKNQEVEQLLQTIGPLMEWTPKREGEVKFSCTAEYYDEFTASIAVETLNGFKFQGRELKVKLHGSPTSLKICMISFVLCFLLFFQLKNVIFKIYILFLSLCYYLIVIPATIIFRNQFIELTILQYLMLLRK